MHHCSFCSEVYGELFAYTSEQYPFNVVENGNVSLHVELKDEYDENDEETSPFRI